VSQLGRWAWLVLLWGCATAYVPRVSEQPPVARDAAEESVYQQVLERYSEGRAVYDFLDSKLFVRATAQARPFVEARLTRRAHFRNLTPAEQRSELVGELKRLENVTEVFFAVHANDSKDDDFDRPTSVWKLGLTVAGDVLRPSSVRRVGRGSIELASIYPYVDTFWTAYVAQFPKASGARAIFTVSSSQGQAELPLALE
jgi:hypothetical protein